MSGDPDSDKIDAAEERARRSLAGEDGENDLAGQVERVVSLLHKLESLYAETPDKRGVGRDAEPDPGDGEDEFLERFAPAPRREIAGPDPYPPYPGPDPYHGVQKAEGREAWQTPPLSADADEAADPGLWYKGALRQHEREVRDKPGVLTKVGLAFAAVLAIILTLPWLVPAALGPEWRDAMAGLAGQTGLGQIGQRETGPQVAERRENPPEPEAVAPVFPPPPQAAAKQDRVAAVEPPQPPPQEREAPTNDAAAPDAGAARLPQTTAPTPAPPEPAEGMSDEEKWQATALKAILDQREAWSKAKQSGDWRGEASKPPVDSRSFGNFESPANAGETPSDPGGTRMAALDDGRISGPGAETADTCESASVEGAQTSIRLNLADPSRAGSQTEVAVNDISYRALFGADGRLSLDAPRLDETAVVRWVQGDGQVCQRAVPRAEGAPMVQVAVMWSGDLGLELEVIEPRSWPGSPTGHITSLQPNLDRVHGAGSIQSFGKPGDPNRSLVYAASVADIGGAGVLNVQVKLTPRAEGGGSCGSSAEVFTNAEAPYEVYIVHDKKTGFRKENRSYAFNVPPCGATASNQRIERMSVRF